MVSKTMISFITQYSYILYKRYLEVTSQTVLYDTFFQTFGKFFTIENEAKMIRNCLIINVMFI